MKYVEKDGHALEALVVYFLCLSIVCQQQVNHSRLKILLETLFTRFCRVFKPIDEYVLSLDGVSSDDCYMTRVEVLIVLLVTDWR